MTDRRNSMLKPRGKNQARSLDILIFDMDGVLIDVSQSYRKTIEKTIQIYLGTCLGLRSGRKKLPLDAAISLFKAAGGFNNDWDLTSGLLLYLLSVSGLPSSSEREKFHRIEEVADDLKATSSEVTRKMEVRLNLPRLSSFLRKVKAYGGGLKGVHQTLQASWEGWVYGSGDLNQENVIKRIFQEVYLGKKFASCYPFRRLFYHGKGYYLREKMLIPRAVLSALQKNIRLGIASGRPRFEAELALRRFHLLPYFESIVTLDESMEEEGRIFKKTGKRVNRSKPHPFPLLRAIREIGLSKPRCGYVGDVVDDIRAARAAKRRVPMLAIGFLSGPRIRTLEEALRQAGSDRVIRHPRELLSLGVQAQGEA
jgi:HAD superfamily phosphatase